MEEKEVTQVNGWKWNPQLSKLQVTNQPSVLFSPVMIKGRVKSHRFVQSQSSCWWVQSRIMGKELQDTEKIHQVMDPSPRWIKKKMKIGRVN